MDLFLFLLLTRFSGFIETHGTEGFVTFGKALDRALRLELSPRSADGAPGGASPTTPLEPPPPAAAEPQVELPREASTGILAKAEGILVSLGVPLKREHFPRLAVAIVLGLLLLIQINAVR